MTDLQPAPILGLVEDDAEQAEMLTEYLSNHGFKVLHAAHGKALDHLLASHTPDLLLLDMMLPGEDGLSIARRLGAQFPIVMMSARAEDADRIAGLELGAEDFVIKPFNLRELLARIRVVLRRSKPSVQEMPAFRFGPFVLDPQRRVLTHEGKRVEITAAEFSLLRILVSHPYCVLSRDRLLDLARTLDETLPFDRSIDARIARLRRKIEQDPAVPQYVRTIRGQGYLFDPTGSETS
ncbi:MAG: response regulator [Halothiobacillus sp.]|jgi:two-component system phosphate regulon response regulator OmpR|nr:response regulator [Halothiobacillus sp.]